MDGLFLVSHGFPRITSYLESGNNTKHCHSVNSPSFVSRGVVRVNKPGAFVLPSARFTENSVSIECVCN